MVSVSDPTLSVPTLLSSSSLSLNLYYLLIIIRKQFPSHYPYKLNIINTESPIKLKIIISINSFANHHQSPEKIPPLPTCYVFHYHRIVSASRKIIYKITFDFAFN